MPSKRKRIGYLPAPSIKELIKLISDNEKLSQSKIVGILVEEALIARGLFDPKNSINIKREDILPRKKTINDYPIKYNDMDELISDKGITYNKRNYKKLPENIPYNFGEQENNELFELFKQFILFQRMIKEKN